MLRFRCAVQKLPAAAVLTNSRLFQPRMNAPPGYRRALNVMPVTVELGEECNHLGKAAYQAKNYGDAVVLYDRALEMRRNVKGPLHEDCAATLNNLGRIFIDMKEFGAAENALTEACGIYDHHNKGKPSLKYAESLALLSMCYIQLKFFPEAEKGFKESLEVYRDCVYDYKSNSWIPFDRVVPDEPNLHPLSGVAHCLADCARLFLLTGQHRRAVAMLEEALDIRRFLYSRHHKFRPIIAQTLGKIAEMRKFMADGAGAEAAATEGLEICIETLGRDSPQTAQLLSIKAMLTFARLDFREARKLLEESSTTYAVTLGKDSSAYGEELLKLGRCMEHLNEFAAAEKLMLRSMEILKEALGNAHLIIAEACTYLGTMLMRLHEITRAKEFFAEALAVRKNSNPNDPALAGVYHKLAEAFAKSSDNQAEGFFLLAIEAYRANSAVEKLQLNLMTDVQDDLGIFYLDYKHFDKAYVCFKESLDYRIANLPETHPTIAYSYSNFSLLYLYQEKFDDCEKFSLLSINMFKQNQSVKAGSVSPLALADAETTYGLCLTQLKRYKEALEMHERALNSRRKMGEQQAYPTAESFLHIARVYVAMEQWDAASEKLEECKKVIATQPRFLERINKEVTLTEQKIQRSSKSTLPKELR